MNSLHSKNKISMKSKLYGILAAALVLLLFAENLKANEVVVSNITLTSTNTTDKYVMVQFDISWENSFRTSSEPNNWDAAWVFVKYRVGSGAWQHAWMNNTGHSGTGATIDAGLLEPGSAFDATTNPALGVFIYRSADGTGTFSITGAQLRWNYGANGVADNDTVDVQVFAIEMVYVPQGNFRVGTGANPAENHSFTQANSTSVATVPFEITSTPPTIQGNNVSSSSSNLGARGEMDLSGTATASLASGFPTGFAAFYCQKYEITQQQYVDFLNTLTTTQAANRYSSSNTTNRYGITASGGAYSTNKPYVACNFLNWMDGAAYSDWAGLRPMTELEFEKACSGTVAPVAREYAWGTATVAGSAYTLINSEQSDEGIATNYSTTAGNASYDPIDGSINGPLRVGIFAGHASNTGRITAGASYYGIMEMSGNLWERAVTVGNVTGRAFTGVHGNGALSTNGHANQTSWPGLSSGEVTGATGSGFRGGSWYLDESNMLASARIYAATASPLQYYDYGFRAVRLAP